MDGKKKLQKLYYEQVQKTDKKIILANPYNHIFFFKAPQRRPCRCPLKVFGERHAQKSCSDCLICHFASLILAALVLYIYSNFFYYNEMLAPFLFFLTCISQQESARLVLKWMSRSSSKLSFLFFFFQGVTFNSLGKEKESLFFQLLVAIFSFRCIFSIVWQMSFLPPISYSVCTI